MQFGGDVVVEYDYLIPLFNVARIAKGSDMSILFDVVSVGKLASSSDAAFSNFTGFPESYADKKKSAPRKKTAVKKRTLSFDGQKFDADEDWVQKMDNMWMLGNDAVISMASLPKLAETSHRAEALMIRRLLEGNGTSYADWRRASVRNAAGSYTLGAVFYDAEKKQATRIVRKLTKKADGSYAFFTMSVFEGAYAANKSYFEGIAGSYTAVQ